jgi:Ca-activated chloride channel family protein
MACLVVAIARPRKGLEGTHVQVETVDIVLLVDVSTSMRAADLGEQGTMRSRLDWARQVMRDFVEQRSSDRIGVVVFAAMPYMASPLTLDHQWLAKRIDRLSSGMLEDGTAIGDALASAVNRLRESEAASQLVVLLTDGENNAGSIAPAQAAQAARALGIRVYTVGAGTDGYVDIPYRSRFGDDRVRREWSHVDEDTLRTVAEITGGRFFRARDRETLAAVYREIDRLERTAVEVETFVQYQEAFPGFVLAALLLLAVERVLSLGWLRRLPV